MTLDVTIEQAYAEACRALGEAVVTQRLMAVELARLQALTTDAPAAPREPT